MHTYPAFYCKAPAPLQQADSAVFGKRARDGFRHAPCAEFRVQHYIHAVSVTLHLLTSLTFRLPSGNLVEDSQPAGSLGNQDDNLLRAWVS